MWTPPGFSSRTVRLVASHCSDCTTVTTISQLIIFIILKSYKMYIITLINNLIFTCTNKDFMFAMYNQQDSTFHSLFISVVWSTCQLKEEALDHTMWRNHFGRGFGPVIWQITDDDGLHVSDGFSVHHQELKTAHTASGICQTNTATC